MSEHNWDNIYKRQDPEQVWGRYQLGQKCKNWKRWSTKHVEQGMTNDGQKDIQGSQKLTVSFAQMSKEKLLADFFFSKAQQETNFFSKPS